MLTKNSWEERNTYVDWLKYQMLYISLLSGVIITVHH